MLWMSHFLQPCISVVSGKLCPPIARLSESHICCQGRPLDHRYIKSQRPRRQHLRTTRRRKVGSRDLTRPHKTSQDLVKSREYDHFIGFFVRPIVYQSSQGGRQCLRTWMSHFLFRILRWISITSGKLSPPFRRLDEPHISHQIFAVDIHHIR